LATFPTSVLSNAASLAVTAPCATASVRAAAAAIKSDAALIFGRATRQNARGNAIEILHSAEGQPSYDNGSHNRCLSRLPLAEKQRGRLSGRLYA
jgi:hypothetical protein